MNSIDIAKIKSINVSGAINDFINGDYNLLNNRKIFLKNKSEKLYICFKYNERLKFGYWVITPDYMGNDNQHMTDYCFIEEYNNIWMELVYNDFYNHTRCFRANDDIKINFNFK